MSDVDCPRAKSWMTPCVARDGATAIDDPAAARPVCVGCGSDPLELLADLAERFSPARRYLQTKDPGACADTLTRMVAEYVEVKP
jgi:hypothetical protein